MLKPCQYRQPTPYPGLSFCQCCKVHSATNLVDADKCNRCNWAETPCAEIRASPLEWPCEPPKKISRSQFVVNNPCASLGEVVRTEECGTCTNKPKIKVFACGLHGECTLAKPLDGIACCATCGDYRATSS